MLRNREFRQLTLWFSVIAAAAAALGFFIATAAGIVSLASSAALGALFYGFTKARYAGLAQIADQIDLVLHHADRMDIAAADEGELSILQTEIKKMTLRIREQNESLKREKERLADSLADIAHQLRTPLTSAALILSLLENPPDEKERKALLWEAKALFTQMDWLLTSLLKLSRLDAGIVVFQNEPVAADALLAAALHPLLIPMELRSITVNLNIPKGITLQGDAGWLAEALQNILKNCMESAGDHATITVTCTDNPLFTEIAIRDNGAGLDEDEIPCLFNRFYRGKKAETAGYGIGLALCHTIITRQGGTVTAKNHPQGGAVFTVRFPK